MDKSSWSSFGRKSFRDFQLVPDGSVLRGEFSSKEIPQICLWIVATIVSIGFAIGAVFGNLGVLLSIALCLFGLFAASTILERSSLCIDLERKSLIVETRSPLRFTNRKSEFRFVNFDRLVAIAIVSHEEDSLVWYVRFRQLENSYQKITAFSFEPSEETNVRRMIEEVASHAGWSHQFVRLSSLGFLAFKFRGSLRSRFAVQCDSESRQKDGF